MRGTSVSNVQLSSEPLLGTMDGIYDNIPVELQVHFVLRLLNHLDAMMSILVAGIFLWEILHYCQLGLLVLICLNFDIMSLLLDQFLMSRRLVLLLGEVLNDSQRRLFSFFINFDIR